MNKATEPFVSIILVNYNGWQDTIECLESLLKIDYANFNIVVVDNASSDDSIQYIKNWAYGNLNYDYNKSPLSTQFAYPPSKKPVSLVVYGADTFNSEVAISNKQITLIQSKTNLGFAGGNNIGTRFILSSLIKTDYFWYLNNDTVVKRNTLSELVCSFQKYIYNNIKLGILGSKLIYYHNPNMLQAIGAIYKPWFGTIKHVGGNEPDAGQYDQEPDKIFLDYVVGASMLVSTTFIEQVGLMGEDYFLYFEELDWAQRGKKKNFTIAYCPESIVYHKEGASIGTNAEKKIKSELSDYYVLKNRIKITKRFYKPYLPCVYLAMMISILNRIKRRQFNRIPMIFRIIFTKH